MAILIRLDDVDSTQRVARQLADDGSPAGTCVVARRQTAGRGRLGRTWVEPAEGLFLSMVLAPRCRPAEAPRVTLGACVGVLRALDALGVPALVKWPNDIVIPMAGAPEGRLGPYRKVAGLLVEVVRMRQTLDLAVLGIGINIRPPLEGWGDALAWVAGALSDAGFAGHSDDVLAAVQQHVPPAIDAALGDLRPTLEVLRARSATLGRRVEIDDDDGKKTGRASALLDDGALLVIDDDGGQHVVRAADVWLAPRPAEPAA